MSTSSEHNSAAIDKPGFWGRLVNNGTYKYLSTVLLASEKRRFILLASLPVIWVLVANVGPILKMIDLSFYKAFPLTAGKEQAYTFDNWVLFFTSNIFYIPFVRTIIFSMTLTFATLLLTYPVAYFLATHVRKERQLLFLLLILIPFWVGEIIRTYAIMILLGNKGLVNIVLRYFDLIDRPIPFMYTNFSLGMGIVYLTSLYMLLPLYSVLEKIPKSMREASADLGAGPWTRMWRVTLPLSKDGIASGCTLVFLISTGYYATPVMLGGPSTTLFSETIAGFFHIAADRWPVGAAFSVIMLVTMLTISGLFLKIMGRGRKGYL